jgi:hypothetical protein
VAKNLHKLVEIAAVHPVPGREGMTQIVEPEVLKPSPGEQVIKTPVQTMSSGLVSPVRRENPILIHQASDTFNSVVWSDLNQIVAVTGSTAYAIADAPYPFAAHLSHAEAADMFRKCNAVADFNSAKVIGRVPSN